MKKLFLLLGLFFTSNQALAKVIILACEPEWRSLAAEIVGKRADAIMAISANQNPAIVSPNRSLEDSFRKADMVFCSGNGLERNWLKQISSNEDDSKTIANQSKVLLAADYVAQKPKSRNGVAPRVHLNPHNILPIAAEFTRRIKKIDASNANFYQKSYEVFVSKWVKVVQDWEVLMQPLKGMKVVISDDAWLELINWLQLDVVSVIDAPKGFADYNYRMNELAMNLRENPAKVDTVS